MSAPDDVVGRLLVLERVSAGSATAELEDGSTALMVSLELEGRVGGIRALVPVAIPLGLADNLVELVRSAVADARAELTEDVLNLERPTPDV